MHEIPARPFGDNTMRWRKRDETLRIRHFRPTKYNFGDRWQVTSSWNIPANSAGGRTCWDLPEVYASAAHQWSKQRSLLVCHELLDATRNDKGSQQQAKCEFTLTTYKPNSSRISVEEARPLHTWRKRGKSGRTSKACWWYFLPVTALLIRSLFLHAKRLTCTITWRFCNASGCKYAEIVRTDDAPTRDSKNAVPAVLAAVAQMAYPLQRLGSWPLWRQQRPITKVGVYFVNDSVVFNPLKTKRIYFI
jgi:hypothetical protein